MKVTLPAGKYFIGDPCYVISDENWEKLGASGFPDGENNVLDASMFMAGTAYGDGEYTDGKYCRYPVDSGTLGAVPSSLIGKIEGRKLGFYGDYPNGLEIEYDGHGFTFGEIHIETEDEDDDEEEFRA